MAKAKPKMLTVDQVAELLNVSADTVNRLIKGEHLRAVDVSPSHSSRRKPIWRVPEDAVSEFLEQRQYELPKLPPRKRRIHVVAGDTVEFFK